jgi:hypothetical protein
MARVSRRVLADAVRQVVPIPRWQADAENTPPANIEHDSGMVKKRLNRFRLAIATTEKGFHARRRSQRSIPVVTNKLFAPIAPHGAPVPHEPMLTPPAAQAIQAEEMENWPVARCPGTTDGPTASMRSLRTGGRRCQLPQPPALPGDHPHLQPKRPGPKGQQEVGWSVRVGKVRGRSG